MGGFLGLGHSSQKTDRKAELTGFGDLQNTFNFGLDTSKSHLATGTATTAQGVQGLTGVQDFWKKYLSGDRTQLAQAIAPEANAVQAQADAARRQRQASATGRTGGTAAAENQVDDATMAQINNFLFGVRPAAAGQEADVSGKIADVGQRDLALALGFGNLAEGSASTLTQAAGESRKTSYQINQDTVAKASQAILNVLGAFA